MGSVNLDNTGSGSAITLSSDGTSLLLNGTAVGGGSANAVPTTTVPVSGQTNNWTVAIGQNVLINVDNNKSSNVGIGYGALELAEDVRTNVAVGGNALRNNGTASFAWQNTAIGVSAGSNVTGGTNNIFMGYNCGGAISGGGQNIIIGAEAYLNKTGSNFQNNVIIGYKAGSGSTQTSPNDQILIGQQAGYNATSGAIAIGNFAVSGNGGFQSVGIGHRALNSGGYIRNTAVGHYCMLNADQTAQENTAMGYYALKQLTTGDGNVAIGNQTALNITTGSYNTLVGNYAGDALTTPTANTFIGQNSGGNITTGSKNTIIGIFNGNQHGLDIRTSSNNIVLSDGDGNPRMHIDSSGNVGIGKTSPQFKLDVDGHVRLQGNLQAHRIKMDNSNAGNKTAMYDTAYVIATTGTTYSDGFGPKLVWRTGGTGYDGYAAGYIGTIRNGADNTHNMVVATYNAGNSVEAINIDNSGHVIIPAGITLGTSTGSMPSSPFTYTAANTLDDYEEGTFTPIFGSGFSGISYAQQHGFYTKVGNTVTIYYSIQLNSSTTTTSSQIVIGNLPFSTSSHGAVYQVASSYISTAALGSGNNALFISSPSSTSIGMYLQNSNGVQARSGNNMGSSFYTSGTLTYFTPA